VLREGGSLREAASLLGAALRRIRSGLQEEGSPTTRAGAQPPTVPGSSSSAAAAAVLPFYLGRARRVCQTTSFRPFLAGMAFQASAATAREAAAAAVCYNLGLAHHLAGLRRAARDRGNQPQEQDGADYEQGGGPGPQARACLRKALRLYRLAAGALEARGGGEGGGGTFEGESTASSPSEDDPLLPAAILANKGHVHLLLLGGEGGDGAGRRVRACADGIAGLLRDPARAGRLAGLVLRGREGAEGEDPVEDGGALLLSLELNVLLHSEAGRPAACA
jgi:hypothetical protein